MSNYLLRLFKAKLAMSFGVEELQGSGYGVTWTKRDYDVMFDDDIGIDGIEDRVETFLKSLPFKPDRVRRWSLYPVSSRPSLSGYGTHFWFEFFYELKPVEPSRFKSSDWKDRVKAKALVRSRRRYFLWPR